MASNTQFVLDGNVIVELDYANNRFRFWPDGGQVKPDAREWNLDEMTAEHWHDGLSTGVLTEIEKAATTLEQRREHGQRLVRRE